MSLKVFISYSRDEPSHKHKVKNLADRLRKHGIACEIDQYYPTPIDGWPHWSEEKITTSDVILVVCSKSYRIKSESDSPKSKGTGVSYEAKIIRDEIYSDTRKAGKFVPIAFRQSDLEFVLTILRSQTHYVLPGQYKELVRRILTSPISSLPPLGPLSAGRKQKSNASKFSLMCFSIRQLLDKNRNAFRNFGPVTRKSTRNPLFWSRQLWEQAKKDIILPNNRKIQTIIDNSRDNIPQRYKKVFDAMEAHLFAFEKHSKGIEMNYSDNRFPKQFEKIVLEKCLRATRKRPKRANKLLLRTLGPLSSYILKASLFGSAIFGSGAPSDVDIAVLMRPLSRQSLQQFSREVRIVRNRFFHRFHRGLHLTFFPSIKSYSAFLKQIGYHTGVLNRR